MEWSGGLRGCERISQPARQISMCKNSHVVAAFRIRDFYFVFILNHLETVTVLHLQFLDISFQPVNVANDKIDPYTKLQFYSS